ncbi:Rid family detoxifying hydrolase [Pseudomonas sp. BN102]|uniref:RidA family protein n=1 Tax=Pseudomonas sp. BN102 TaxID=2567886 RepID=UPI002457B002|nr:Rid family detoxifying hydrolase [Pseudomonas sp. BN102]MDH4611588.1 RidA family protein [Pseudomonas sp. BN102]
MKNVRAFAVGVCALFSIAAASAETQFLNSGKVLKGEFPFSEAVKVGGMLYLSGQIGIVPSTQKLAPGGIEAESRQAMENIKTVVEAHGYSMKDIVKCTVFLVDLNEWGTFNDVYKSYFVNNQYPARSALGVNALALNSRVEVECVAASS